MSFFEPNHLSISIWTLLGVLVCAAIAIFVWRITKGRRKAGEKMKANPLGSTKMTAQIALGMNITFGFRTLANILVKNRYAKAGFSLMPVLVEHRNVLFLMGNVVDGTKRDVTIGKLNGRLDAWFTGKKGPVPCTDWSFSYYHDWERFLRGLGYQVLILKIVPYVGKVIIEQNDPSLIFLPVEDIGSEIIEMVKAVAANEHVVGNNNVESLFVSLSDLNMFTKKGQSPRRLAKRLME